MNNDKPFICWTYDPQVNRHRADIIERLLAFIREGMREHQSTALVDAFRIYETSIKSSLYERLRLPMAKPAAKRMLNDAGDTVELLAAAFLQEHRWVTHDAPIAAFHLTNDPETDALTARLGAKAHPVVDEEGGLSAAFEVTFSNFARCCTRMTLIHTISTLLCLKKQAHGVDRISEELWSRKMGFQRDLLLFGGLLGGSFLATAVGAVATQVCYTKPGAGCSFSVIHFLQLDGVMPGRWMSAPEEKLVKDIKDRYEAL